MVVELCRPSMADAGVPSACKRRRARKRAWALHIKAAALIEEVDARGIHGGARSHAWRMHGHFVEHVVGDGVGKVGADFGLATGRFGPWTLNEICCTPDGL